MKLNRKVALRLTSAGYPAQNRVFESETVETAILLIAKWMTLVPMSSRINITIARDAASFDSDKAHRESQAVNRLEGLLSNLLESDATLPEGDEDDDESNNRQGVATATLATQHESEPQVVKPEDRRFPANPDSPSRASWNLMSEEQQQKWLTHQKLAAAERSEEQDKPHGAKFGLRKD